MIPGIAKYSTVAAYLLATLAYASPSLTRAEDNSALAGTYCLTGVRETGSCLTLAPNGRFEYFLAYGAYDENSEGTWSLENGEIILNSFAYGTRPAFAFKEMRPGEDGRFDVVVESKAGGAISGIDVRVNCDGKTVPAGVTGAVGYKVDCLRPPAEISLGLKMYGLAFRKIDVSAQAGTGKIYVFEFDPGDLGHKKFVARHLRFKSRNRLVMIYDDSPIEEFVGRAFEFVRQ